jgi:hypothetical protein
VNPVGIDRQALFALGFIIAITVQNQTVTGGIFGQAIAAGVKAGKRPRPWGGFPHRTDPVNEAPRRVGHKKGIAFVDRQTGYRIGYGDGSRDRQLRQGRSLHPRQKQPCHENCTPHERPNPGGFTYPHKILNIHDEISVITQAYIVRLLPARLFRLRWPLVLNLSWPFRQRQDINLKMSKCKQEDPLAGEIRYELMPGWYGNCPKKTCL